MTKKKDEPTRAELLAMGQEPGAREAAEARVAAEANEAAVEDDVLHPKPVGEKAPAVPGSFTPDASHRSKDHG